MRPIVVDAGLEDFVRKRGGSDGFELWIQWESTDSMGAFGGGLSFAIDPPMKISQEIVNGWISGNGNAAVFSCQP